MDKLRIVLVALATVLVAVALLIVPPTQPVHAQADQCRSQCEAQFAQCYRASNANRKLCDVQRTQCLEGCIKKR